MPVAQCGDRHLAIFHHEQLRAFLGIAGEDELAPYPALAAALDRVLDAVERAVVDLPLEHMTTVTHVQDRDARELILFLLAPFRGYVPSLDRGHFNYEVNPVFLAQPFSSPPELARFTRAVRAPVIERAMLVTDEQAEESISTSRGALTHLLLLDYLSGRSAYFLQHCYRFLRHVGVEPRDPLSVERMRPIHTGHFNY